VGEETGVGCREGAGESEEERRDRYAEIERESTGIR